MFENQSLLTATQSSFPNLLGVQIGFDIPSAVSRYG